MWMRPLTRQLSVLERSSELTDRYDTVRTGRRDLGRVRVPGACHLLISDCTLALVEGYIQDC